SITIFQTFNTVFANCHITNAIIRTVYFIFAIFLANITKWWVYWHFKIVCMVLIIIFIIVIICNIIKKAFDN
ncbi:MAG: hypothetical protein ACTSRH_09345, partial [Promethearchaeota archaeon]